MVLDPWTDDCLYEETLDLLLMCQQPKDFRQSLALSGEVQSLKNFLQGNDKSFLRQNNIP